MGGPRFVQTTREPRGGAADGRRPAEPMLVLAHHPALARAGEALAIGDGIELSRLAPAFGDAGPLDDPYVSRRAIGIARAGDGIVLQDRGLDLTADGAPVRGARRLSAAELARGVELVLGKRVVFVVTTDHAPPTHAGDLGMFGATGALARLREDVRAAAAGPGPTLVLGETGAGKELVARALHAAGPRAAGPFVAVNVAAIPAQVAAAELFGHERGAFTGAGERRAGYFERAAGGTLFLDEIADLPEAVQPMLLRALESGEIQPVGGQPRRVATHVVAATDGDLARAVRGALYHRLAATTLHVPPLRERRADVGPMLARFLLELVPAELADRTLDATPWLPADVVAALVRAPWPGNVRQLRAVAQRLAAIARAGRIAAAADVDADEAETENVLADDSPIDADRLVETLRTHRFQLNRTAEALGISRTHLDALIARSPHLRKAKDLTPDEIAAAAAAAGDDVDAMAARLEVSPRGLRLRMRQLGLIARDTARS
ncbi:MAG: sigma-54-dependent Fis family transcriptional regulator [Deltaproteobacteria bacterium]|nr:sigma-54-dependent Fis family transcriptional regulator [Deltaproteobacteria bacterium]